MHCIGMRNIGNPEPEDIDRFRADEGHAGLDGFRGGPDPREMVAQMCTNPNQDVAHPMTVAQRDQIVKRARRSLPCSALCGSQSTS